MADVESFTRVRAAARRASIRSSASTKDRGDRRRSRRVRRHPRRRQQPHRLPRQPTSSRCSHAECGRTGCSPALLPRPSSVVGRSRRAQLVRAASDNDSSTVGDGRHRRPPIRVAADQDRRRRPMAATRRPRRPRQPMAALADRGAGRQRCGAARSSTRPPRLKEFVGRRRRRSRRRPCIGGSQLDAASPPQSPSDPRDRPAALAPVDLPQFRPGRARLRSSSRAHPAVAVRDTAPRATCRRSTTGDCRVLVEVEGAIAGRQ